MSWRFPAKWTSGGRVAWRCAWSRCEADSGNADPGFASKKVFCELIEFADDSGQTRAQDAAISGHASFLIKTSCANRKDYLHCVLSLEEATTHAGMAAPRPLLDPLHFQRNRHQDAIVNSRIAHRNALALVGLSAFACAVSPAASPLPMGQVGKHRESEDRPDPGGSRV